MQYAFRTSFRMLGLALGLAMLTGCDRKTLHGTYQATSFTYAQAGGVPANVLAAGGSVTLTIGNDFGTTGTMMIPASVSGGSNTTVSLLGSAAQQGDIVILNLVTDTFLRDIEFSFDGNTLTGSRTFSGVTVAITLAK